MEYLYLIKKHRFKILFYTALVFILCVRLPLITKGHLYHNDELRYRFAFNVIDSIGKGDMKNGLSYLFQAVHRPGFVMLSIVPASIQRLFDSEVGKNKVSRDDLWSYNIPSFINTLVSAGICLAFYGILKLLTGNKWLALTGMTVFSMFNVNYFYIRSMTPVTWAMLIFLVLLYFILKKGAGRDPSPKEVICYGLTLGVMFTIYCGYYPLVVLAGGLVVLSSRKKIKTACILVASFLIPVMFFETISWYTGLIYLFSRGKTKIIYDEMYGHGLKGIWKFGFPIDFMGNIEGIPGYVFLALFLVFLFFVLFRQKTDRRLKIIYSIWFLIYLSFILENYFLNKLHMRTRLFYPYIILIILGVFILINEIKKGQRIILLCSFLFMVPFFVLSYRTYLRITYPPDLRLYMKKTYPDKNIIYTTEFYPKDLQKKALYFARKSKFDFIGVNVCVLGGQHMGEHKPIHFPKEMLHLSYPQPTVLFGAYRMDERRSDPEENKLYTMRIYKIR